MRRDTTANFEPIPVVDLDLTASVDRSAGTGIPAASRAHVLVRRAGWPVGQFLLQGADPMEWRAELAEIAPELTDLGDPDATQAASAADEADDLGARLTVVVPTLGSSPWLEPTVRAVLRQSVRVREVMVVDNDPASGATRTALGDLLRGADADRLRIVPEPRRGVSRARNTGARTARTEFVAFTDDDATPDPDWCEHLLRTVVRDPAIGCVTSLVVPAALTTREQLLFEQYGGFGKGYRVSVWCLGALEGRIIERLAPSARAAGSPWPPRAGHRGAAFPYTAGEFGAGVVLFRRDLYSDLGGFDPALGPGTPTHAGEDLDLCRRTYLAGRAVVYQPAAVVRHHHRDDPGALADQVRGYGVGLTAALTKLLITSPRHVVGFAGRIPAALRMLLSPDSTKNRSLPDDFPAELVTAERRGILVGPWRYLVSRWRGR